MAAADLQAVLPQIDDGFSLVGKNIGRMIDPYWCQSDGRDNKRERARERGRERESERAREGEREIDREGEQSKASDLRVLWVRLTKAL